MKQQELSAQAETPLDVALKAVFLAKLSLLQTDDPAVGVAVSYLLFGKHKLLVLC